jgi:hypothetical protein
LPELRQQVIHPLDVRRLKRFSRFHEPHDAFPGPGAQLMRRLQAGAAGGLIPQVAEQIQDGKLALAGTGLGQANFVPERNQQLGVA